MKYVFLLLLLTSGALAQYQPDWMGVQFNDGASLTTQPLTETFTVGTGGVTANTLVVTDSNNPANIVAAAGGTVYGISMNTAAAGGTVEVARFGQAGCVVDTGGAITGHLAIVGTGNLTYCKDSGQTVASNIPIGTAIIGLFRTSVPAGSMAMVELTPAHHGTQIGEVISLDGSTQGSYSAVNLATSTGLNWQLSPNGQTLTISPQLDSAVVPNKVAANSYAAGAKQSVAPSTSTAGLNVGSGVLPSNPAKGDIATDGAGNLNWYDGMMWRLGAVADTVLPPGAPVVGNGANHVTAGSTTGSGAFVLASGPAISNPLITSFINSNHDHSNSANGGGLSASAFNSGANASSSTFLRGDGVWSSPPPAPVSSVFGRSGAVSAQSGDYTAAQVTNAAQTNASNAFIAGTQDFSSAAHTLPAKAGPAVSKPASCTVGEMYFATDAAAGQNWYYCTAANTWTAQFSGATTNQNIRRIAFGFDGAGAALSGTLTRCNNVDFAGTIQQFAAIGDQAGSAIVKIFTVALASYSGPSSALDISNGGESITNSVVKSDPTLSNWNKSLNANTVVCAQISNVAGFNWLQGELKVAAN